MKWKDAEQYATEIFANLAGRTNCVEMISALQKDLAIDIYLDTQPGGGNCESTNYRKQEKYEQLLDKLYDVKSIIPDIKESDIPAFENLMEKFSHIYKAHFAVENRELTDIITQGFEFIKHCNQFSEKEITDETINTFIDAGKYISEKMVAYDEINECFYRQADIKENMGTLLRELNISDDELNHGKHENFCIPISEMDKNDVKQEDNVNTSQNHAVQKKKGR